ncbi:hypothetical protein NMY22_g12308 [Coprinellus aureogranulatus]|nr:hypothetical protein NMY22_g12308 [Coprinellus aureogranulatus]
MKNTLVTHACRNGAQAPYRVSQCLTGLLAGAHSELDSDSVTLFNALRLLAAFWHSKRARQTERRSLNPANQGIYDTYNRSV